MFASDRELVTTDGCMSMVAALAAAATARATARARPLLPPLLLLLLLLLSHRHRRMRQRAAAAGIGGSGGSTSTALGSRHIMAEHREGQTMALVARRSTSAVLVRGAEAVEATVGRAARFARGCSSSSDCERTGACASAAAVGGEA